MVAFGCTVMRRKQRKPGKSFGEPLPVKSSKKTTYIHAGDFNIDIDSTNDTMDPEDKTNMEDKTDSDEKSSNEDNNNYVNGADLKNKLPTFVIGDHDPNLHDESISAKNDDENELELDSDREPMEEILDESIEKSDSESTDVIETDKNQNSSSLLERMIGNSPSMSDSGDSSRLEIIAPDLENNDLSHTGASASKIRLPINKEDLCIPEASRLTLPNMKEILDYNPSMSNENSSSSDVFAPSPSNLILPRTDKPKAPYKGTMVPCGQLKDYLDALPTFNRKCMLRKGREVHKIYVDMTKGETFLDDQFAYTEFGRMVLSNGSIRAGRAKNAKQIVVARETLYCSGTSACKRACGGYGICLPGCDKTKMRGHRCSYRIKLTQRLGYVNFWFVEELGSHDQLNGKDCDFKVNSEMASNLSSTTSKDSTVMDLSNGGFKFRAANIPRSTHKKLAPKSTTPSPDRSLKQLKGGQNHSVSDFGNGDAPPSYHYVLGLMPNNSPSRESPLQTPPSTLMEQNSDSIMNAMPSRPQDSVNAFSEGNLATPGILATVPVTTATAFHPDIASQIFQANLLNYMSTMTNLGLGAAIPGAVNPLLVSVKQEPQDPVQGQFSVGQGHGQIPVNGGQGQIAVGLPLMTLPNQFQFSSSQMINPSHSPSPSRSQGHSPSPSRGQGHHGPSPSRNKHYRERSPLVRDQCSNVSGIQKGMEIEAKIKNEAGRKLQAQEDTLGQVHNRIMERAKCRKSSHTNRVPPKGEGQILDLSDDKMDCEYFAQQNQNIPVISSSAFMTSSLLSSPVTSNSIENSGISSLAYQRFQTLNRVLQSHEFQEAKNKLEKNTKLNIDFKQEDGLAPLNLVVKQQKVEKENVSEGSHHQYFKLAEEWKKGQQLFLEKNEGKQFKEEEQLLGKIVNGDNVLNGHADILNSSALFDTEKLTENEKELMCRVRQLESHVKQLQNIVIKKDVSTSQPVSGRRKAKPAREIDFNKYNTRHVALKVMYLGMDYQGYASQEDSDKTIEHALFEALKKTKLIESREASCYSRCGRTDKGVSAFGQVISLDLRSNLLSGVGIKVREGGTAADRPGDKTAEIQYCHILNRNLPPEIRVLAWAPVDPEFSSRFSCKKRTYKYFFPKGNLNIEIMEQACGKLLGEHDFRNFCKVNVENTTNHVRRIISADIKPLNDSDDGGYTMYELTIVGTAFLYHQIRCIVAILFLVGKQLETPEVIEELLNVEKNPRRPQYNWASDIPLCLYDADFGDEFEWIYEAYWHEDNIKHLQQLWAEHSIKATMLKRMLEDLDKAKVETECDIAPWSDLSPPVLNQAEWIAPEKFKVYKPLMERQSCPTVEEKIETLAKKRKLNPEDETDPSEKDGE